MAIMLSCGGTGLYYYHYDGLGSVIALSNEDGEIVERYSYDVFGDVTIRDANDEIRDTSLYGNPYMFTGRRYDSETGNYYYRNRYYNPDIGRFLQPDIGFIDGMNLYTYCGNNPIMWIDPWGLCKDDKWYKKAWEGDYVGAQFGDEALDWYAHQIAFGDDSWYNYVGGFFSAMWTPKSWKSTTLTLGTACASAGSIAAKSTTGYEITGFTKHGINRVIERGINPGNILNTVRSPLKVVSQSGGRSKLVGKLATVVLNKSGKVITAWPK